VVYDFMYELCIDLSRLLYSPLSTLWSGIGATFVLENLPPVLVNEYGSGDDGLTLVGSK